MYEKQLNEYEKNPEIVFNSQKSPKKQIKHQSFLVNDDFLTLDEIQELAHRPASEELLQAIKEREEYSEKLLEACKSDECKVISHY